MSDSQAALKKALEGQNLESLFVFQCRDSLQKPDTNNEGKLVWKPRHEGNADNEIVDKIA